MSLKVTVSRALGRMLSVDVVCLRGARMAVACAGVDAVVILQDPLVCPAAGLSQFASSS